MGSGGTRQEQDRKLAKLLARLHVTLPKAEAEQLCVAVKAAMQHRDEQVAHLPFPPHRAVSP